MVNDKELNVFLSIPEDKVKICKTLLALKARGLKKIVFEILYPYVVEAREEWKAPYSFLLKILREGYGIDFPYKTFLIYVKKYVRSTPDDTASAKEKKKNSQNSSRLGNYDEKKEYNSNTEAEGSIHAASFGGGLTDARAKRQENSPLIKCPPLSRPN